LVEQLVDWLTAPVQTLLLAKSFSSRGDPGARQGFRRRRSWLAAMPEAADSCLGDLRLEAVYM
jgi:hypothetical protein